MSQQWFRCILAVALPALLGAQTVSVSEISILQIRIVEGEGTVHRAGTRAVQPLVVQITDETGKPLDHVAVSFRLPDDGPSGAFPNGLRSEIAITGADGRVTVHGIRWNDLAGPLQIRITAARDKARAGAVVSQYLSDAVPSRPTAVKSGGGRSYKWAILAIAAASVGGGVAANMARGSSASAAGPITPAAVTAPPISIGTPSITIGKP